jgi:hypothetical protein
VDRLVASYLEDEIKRIDVSRVRSRLEPQIADSAIQGDSAVRMQPSMLPTRRSRRLAWTLGSSLAIAVAFWGGRYVGPGSASAATVLQTVRSVHSRPIDRCYQVHYAPDNRYWDGHNKLLGPSQSLLWTRGDRFLAECTIGDLQLTIGRDIDGLLWINSSKKQGVLFEGSDARLPKDLETLCAINSMSLPKLVDDVLADFDLRVEERSSAHGEGTLVWADLKPGHVHSLISAALIEVDAKSHAIERLVIWVLRDGHPNGTVTYTLIDSERRDDNLYRMKSQLDGDAKIDVRRLDEAN